MVMKIFNIAAGCLFIASGYAAAAMAEGGTSKTGIKPLHGATQNPMARQLQCKNDGGFEWPDDGSGIPNAACKAAFLYNADSIPVWERKQMFNEWSAYSQNLAGTTHPSEKVPDEQLCSAGIAKFRGINEPSAAWKVHTVSVKDGIATLTYSAAKVHEPSKWTIYLSKPGFDSATQRLKWADLLPLAVDKVDVPTTDPGEYKIHVKVPSENYVQDKNSVLYVQWEREDPAQETFFSCSDVLLTSASNTKK